MKTAMRTIALLALLATSIAAQEPSAAARAQRLRRAVAEGEQAGASHGDLARYRSALSRLYPDSAPAFLWWRGTTPTRQAVALLAELASAERRGLRARDYDAAPLAAAFDGSRRPGAELADEAALIRADAWLTLSAIRYMEHVHRGRVDPAAFRFALPPSHGRHDFAPLVRAMRSTADVHAMLDSLKPPFARFRALEPLLARYRALAADSAFGPLPRLASPVREGGRWSGLPEVRRRLAAMGDVAAAAARSSDDSLEAALVAGVKRFQRRHGLAQDGVIGPATMAQIAVPFAARVAQIEIAMERWRWLPEIASARLVVVNIPAYRLYAIDRTAQGPAIAQRMDVIVGSAYAGRHTPVFTSTMREVVFQPFWDVPPSIARREEIPHIRRDPGYADRLGLEIVSGGDVGATVFAMTGANLSRVGAGSLRLRQRPGPMNALGAVKFSFPNRYNVYIHGTPLQSLFAQARRDFSHGCIRASDPARLAEWVLAGQPGWDSARIAERMSATGKLLRVRLEEPIPVLVLYATVATDDDGTAYFYPDIYGHDAALGRALGLPVIA